MHACLLGGAGGQDVAGVLARHALADPVKMDYNSLIVAYGAPPPPPSY